MALLLLFEFGLDMRDWGRGGYRLQQSSYSLLGFDRSIGSMICSRNVGAPKNG